MRALALAAVLAVAATASAQDLSLQYATDGQTYTLASKAFADARDLGRGLSYAYGVVAGVRGDGLPVAGLSGWVQADDRKGGMFARVSLSVLPGRQRALVLGLSVGRRL